MQLRPIMKAYLTSTLIWFALSLVTAWRYYSMRMALGIHSSLSDILILAEVRGFTYALLTPPVFALVRRYSIGFGSLLGSALWSILGAAPFMACYMVIRWVIYPSWDYAAQGFVPRSLNSLTGLLGDDGAPEVVATYIGIILAAHAYGYFATLRGQEIEKYDLEQALTASETQLLKIQFRPTFLFNTLNGIAALIGRDRKNAKAMVIKLSHLLRTALDRGTSDLIPLREELRFQREYLDLEKMRLGPRLKVDWSVDADTERVLVPQMILQPLVENAIRHGIAASKDGGWVEISSHRTDGGLQLSVRNSLGETSPEGSGVGLRNTAARLKHLYSEDATVSFSVSERRTATATLLLPALVADEQAALAT